MVQIRSILPILETNCIEHQNIGPCICEFYYTFRDTKISSLPQIRCSFLTFIITGDNLKMTVLFKVVLSILSKRVPFFKNTVTIRRLNIDRCIKRTTQAFRNSIK